MRGIINGTLREKLARTGPVGPRWERVFLDRAEASDMAVRQERARLLALSLVQVQSKPTQRTGEREMYCTRHANVYMPWRRGGVRVGEGS